MELHALPLAVHSYALQLTGKLAACAAFTSLLVVSSAVECIYWLPSNVYDIGVHSSRGWRGGGGE